MLQRLLLRAAILGVLAFGLSVSCEQAARTSTLCDEPPRTAQSSISLPGHPGMVVVAPDGCHAFVGIDSSNPRSQTGIGVLQRSQGTLKLVRVQALESSPAGIALTHDGKIMAVADDDYVVFVDVRRLLNNQGDAVLGYTTDGNQPGTVDIKISPEGHYAFASDENTRR